MDASSESERPVKPTPPNWRDSWWAGTSCSVWQNQRPRPVRSYCGYAMSQWLQRMERDDWKIFHWRFGLVRSPESQASKGMDRQKLLKRLRVSSIRHSFQVRSNSKDG